MLQTILTEAEKEFKEKFTTIDMRWSDDTFRAWWLSLEKFLTNQITKSYEAGIQEAAGRFEEASKDKVNITEPINITRIPPDIAKILHEEIEKETRQKLLKEIEGLRIWEIGCHPTMPGMEKFVALEDIKKLLI